MPWTENTRFVARKIAQSSFKRFAKNSSNIETRANRYIKESIEHLNAKDTMALKDNTFAKMRVQPLKILISLYAIAKRPDGQPYAIFVRKGLGPNRKYGKRDFLQRAAGLLLRSFGLRKGVDVLISSSGNPRTTPTLREQGRI